MELSDEQNRDEIIAMAKEAGIDFEPLQSITGQIVDFTDGSQSLDRMTRFAALVAAKERERLFGLERSGDMRLMLHRWEGRKCYASATHFRAEQVRFGPSGMLDRAVERMSADIDRTIREGDT